MEDDLKNKVQKLNTKLNTIQVIHYKRSKKYFAGPAQANSCKEMHWDENGNYTGP